jgi:uncharacterized Tic20 family protein
MITAIKNTNSKKTRQQVSLLHESHQTRAELPGGDVIGLVIHWQLKKANTFMKRKMQLQLWPGMSRSLSISDWWRPKTRSQKRW